MNNRSVLDRYLMVGLSADWVFPTWKISEDFFICQNQDDNVYELIKKVEDESQLFCSGTIEECFLIFKKELEYATKGKNNK